MDATHQDHLEPDERDDLVRLLSRIRSVIEMSEAYGRGDVASILLEAEAEARRLLDREGGALLN